MRVLLAQAPHFDTFGYSMPPPGLLRLGGELRRRGIAVALEDLAYRLAAAALPHDDSMTTAAAELLLERCATARGEPALLGLSVMGATVPAALAIAREVRRRAPALRVVLGGPGTTGLDAALLERFPSVEAVVRGEGEETLPELVERWAGGRDLEGVRGTSWRDARGAVRREVERPPLADLGELAPYAWDLLPPLADYKRLTGEAEGLTPVDSGRGCVYDCSFCTIGRFWGRRSRVVPAARLADEIEALRSIPAARNAYLCHDLFGADRDHALELCDELVRRASGVRWECRARVDHLDEELLERMGRAGCYRVLLGVESGATEVLERCDKRLRPRVDVPATVAACAQNGITPILSLILGLPGEGDAELRATLQLCARASLQSGVQLSLHLPNPQPGCGLGEELGARSRPVAGIPPDMALGAGRTAPERALIEAHPDLFSTWALLPLGEERLRELHAIATALPQVLMRYPRTFALLEHATGHDALALVRAWRAGGRSFETFARGARDALVADALRWEQALVRAAARGAREAGYRSEPGGVPRAAAEVLALRHDLPAVVRALARGEEPGPDARRDVWLAVAAGGTLGAGAAGVRSWRVSDDVARLLEVLDGRADLDALERRHPGIGPALARLAREGLVAFGPPAPARAAPGDGAAAEAGSGGRGPTTPALHPLDSPAGAG